MPATLSPKNWRRSMANPRACGAPCARIADAHCGRTGARIGISIVLSFATAQPARPATHARQTASLRDPLRRRRRGGRRAPGRPGARAAAGIPGLVRPARLAAARAPAGPARQGGAAPLDPADRADRRGQDAGRLPAEPGRAVGRCTANGAARHPHALHLAAQGARRRRGSATCSLPSRRWALPIRVETRTGDTSTSRKARQRVPPARHAAHHARAGGPAAVARRRAAAFRRARHRHPRRAACARAPPSAATCWRSTSPGSLTHRARPRPHRPVGHGGAAERAARLPRCRSPATAPSRLADLVIAEGGARPDIRILETELPLPWAGHTTRYAVAEIYAAIKAHQPVAGVRQHAQPGRADVPGAVARQRRQPADRAAPRLARRRAPPQGRGRHGRRRAQGRGVHLHARPRHRLGRRRPRHQRRRAEGREPADPARRPRQPSPRRALARAAGAVQPLRGAGMPGGDRRRRGRRPRRRAIPHRRARRARPARVGHGLRGAVRARRAVPRGRSAAPYAGLDARPVRPHRRVRRHRRLRAAGLRALRPPASPRATAACASPIRASPSNTA